MCVNASKMVDRTIAGVKKNPLNLLGAMNPLGMFGANGAWVSALGSGHQSGKK